MYKYHKEREDSHSKAAVFAKITDMDSICTDKAKELGYQFTELKDWIYELLDYYIQVVEEMDKVDNGRFH